MGIWLYFLIIILVVILILLILKLLLVKKSIKEITILVNKIIKVDTNNLITISSRDRDVQRLAHHLNKILKDLRTQEIEYQTGNRNLKKLITNISHDLRTPLTAIKGYVDLLSEENIDSEIER